MLVLALGFALRLVPVRADYHYWDETVYLQHAEIISGESPDNYNEFEFRPPLLPILLSPVVLLFDSVIAVHIVISLLSTLGIFATYWLAEDLFGSETAIVSSVIYALSPLAIKLSHDVLVDPVLPLLWVSAAAALYRGLKTESKSYNALAGVFLGLSVLMKFTSLVLLPAVALAVLLYRRKRISEIYSRKAFSELFWRNEYVIPVTFILTVLPYLLWSYVSFGSPLHVFVEAMGVSGAPDSFMTYAKGLGSYVLIPFYAGAVFYLIDFNREFRYLYPLVFLLALFIPAQFWLGNKELRFLLPVVPFLSIVSARGFIELKERINISKHQLMAAVSALLILSTPLLASGFEDRNPVKHGIVKDVWHPPVEIASRWLKAESDEDAVVYTNHRYPPIGYYSKRYVKLIPRSEPLNKSELEPGYVYYSRDSPYKYPEKERLMNDKEFVRNKTFNKTVEIFYFTGEQDQ